MAEVNVERTGSQGNLFLPVSGVMPAEAIDQAREPWRRCPAILERIAEDQDRLALERRHLRREPQAWFRRRAEPLPGMAAFCLAGSRRWRVAARPSPDGRRDRVGVLRDRALLRLDLLRHGCRKPPRRPGSPRTRRTRSPYVCPVGPAPRAASRRRLSRPAPCPTVGVDTNADPDEDT